MTKDSKEYKKLKAEHDAEEKYRKDHPELFPWFVYFQFGWHNMTNVNDEELADILEFYKGLYSDGKGGYCRYGRQPIFITRRKEAKPE